MEDSPILGMAPAKSWVKKIPVLRILALLAVAISGCLNLVPGWFNGDFVLSNRCQRSVNRLYLLC